MSDIEMSSTLMEKPRRGRNYIRRIDHFQGDKEESLVDDSSQRTLLDVGGTSWLQEQWFPGRMFPRQHSGRSCSLEVA